MIDDLRDRLRPIWVGLFPRLLLLEIQDQRMRGQLMNDLAPGPIAFDVPLPPQTCRNGMPLQKEPLGDLLGDLLVQENLIDACVLAALPTSAVTLRLLEWRSGNPGQDTVEAIRQQDPPMKLPYALADADLDLQPLAMAGQSARMLLGAAQRPLVKSWLEVFELAGAHLDRLAPAQSCQLAAITPLLAGTPSRDLVVLVDPEPTGCHLMLLLDGVPVFERRFGTDEAELVAEVGRCVRFYLGRDGSVASRRLLLSAPIEKTSELEEELEVRAETLAAHPWGSLVLQGLAPRERPQ